MDACVEAGDACVGAGDTCEARVVRMGAVCFVYAGCVKSTVRSVLNAVAACVVEDLIRCVG